ncbi:MAG: hypothetical protein ACI4U3_01045 [Traorella sp.]
MFSYSEYITQKSIELGKEQGIELGNEEGIMNCINNLIINSSCTLEEAFHLLNVPIELQENIKKRNEK